MKSTFIRHCILIVELILISACTLPGSQPTAAPTQIAATQVETVDLAGPEMKVGATWQYADGTLLVAVPGGTFTRGGAEADAPVQQIDVSDFWIYRTKVTNAQYEYCVAMGICTAPSKSDNPNFTDPAFSSSPVVGVDFAQASDYCSFVHARLPTEAEWEKAARGPDGQTYPWGEGKPDCSLLNYAKCVGTTTPVTNYPSGQSYYTAYDMEGNTLEWIGDRYDKDYYASSPLVDPPGPDKGRFRVVRSSAFDSGGDQTQAWNRFYSNPDDHRANTGFRCVVKDPTYFAAFCAFPATYGTDGVGGPIAGEQPVENCPNNDIHQDSECAGAGKPVTYITRSIDQYGHFSPPCTVYSSDPQAGSITYACTQNGQFNSCVQCTVELRSEPQCPDGYHFGESKGFCYPNTPAQAASAGNCLPGFALQEQAQQGTGTDVPAQGTSACCTVDTSTSAPASPLLLAQMAVDPVCTQTGNGTSCRCPPFYVWDIKAGSPTVGRCTAKVPDAQGNMAADCYTDPGDTSHNGPLTCTCPPGYGNSQDAHVCDPHDPIVLEEHCIRSHGGGVDPNGGTIPPICDEYSFDGCPAGTSFDGNECISTHYRQHCTTQGIALSSCTSNGPGSAACGGKVCGYGKMLDANCQCICDPSVGC